MIDIDCHKMALDEATGKRIKVDIDVPKWDQTTYWGRATHFFTTANPLNLFASPSQLESAKDVVTRYRKVGYRLVHLLQHDYFKILEIGYRTLLTIFFVHLYCREMTWVH